MKQELGLEDEPGRKTRFDPPEPVASGISLGIKPLTAGTVTVLVVKLETYFIEKGKLIVSYGTVSRGIVWRWCR